MSRTKLIWMLAGLALIDTVLPIPFFALGAIYVVVKRPVKVLRFAEDLYAAK